ncbi:zinc metalloproteinase nas-13-like [Paramacrobiotus metropolitanus]|uniref:zinc metalloproteinase nas-13-like n=1 Tax=Paramacrobiotus metropolitanus TaxID=2943436 RepID=UPI002446216C|nr:zinc metalloproteinase nas-13-like [Paramacrobiotus metropolitanus]
MDKNVFFLMSFICAVCAAPFDLSENAQFDLKVTGKTLFEGDIAGVIQPGETAADLRTKLDNLHKAGVAPNLRWPNGVIHYQFTGQFSQSDRNAVREAMTEITTKTTNVIRFQERYYETDYVNIVKEAECSSEVGKIGGAQKLSLTDACIAVKGAIIHELMHAIGFWHEQSRFDRDAYVEINWSNIPENKRPDFEVRAYAHTYGTAYDFGSIMHSGPCDSAVDPCPTNFTITAITSTQTFGQRNGLSQIDIQEIRAMYGATTTTINPSGKSCATLFHNPNFLGTNVILMSGHNGNLEPADAGLVRSARVWSGCTLTTYPFVGLQGAGLAYPTFPPSDGFFNFSPQNPCSSARCTCI